MLGPDALIGVELAVVLDRDPSTARATARRHTAVYVGLPNYTNNLRQFGYGDDDFAKQGSDRLVDAIVAWGDVDAIATRVQAMRDAGADHVCIQVIRPDDDLPAPSGASSRRRSWSNGRAYRLRRLGTLARYSPASSVPSPSSS